MPCSPAAAWWRQRAEDGVLDGRRRLVAGRHADRAGAVGRDGVVRRADDGELVHDLGHLGQMLADLDAGHVGGDRLELAADALRGFRFEVPHVDGGGAAGQPEHDDGVGLRLVLASLSCRRRLASSRSSCGSVRPNSPAVPILRKSRRWKPSQSVRNAMPWNRPSSALTCPPKCVRLSGGGNGRGRKFGDYYLPLTHVGAAGELSCKSRASRSVATE